MDNNFINIIPLSKVDLASTLISNKLLEVIADNKKNSKKTILFYNRRGTARAWMCKDCGYFDRCPHCDIAFAYHTSPIKRLVCHQCNTVAPFPIHCPHCHGNNIVGVGVGIEKIFNDLQSILGEGFNIIRVDSDNKTKLIELYSQIQSSDVILSTSLGSTLVDSNVGGVAFLLFEVNLSIPEYDMEEQLYDEILFYKKQKLPIYLQTYTHDHPLILEILHGNQNSYFNILQKERKNFNYPPFSEFVTLRVHHPSQDNVTRMISHLVHKINTLKDSDTFIASDRDIWEKKAGEWSQKIILKGKNLSSIVRELEIEVVRNRSVSLEWN